MIEAQLVIMGISLIGSFFYLAATHNWKQVLAAAVLSLGWVLASGIYSYRGFNMTLLGINVFPASARRPR